MRPTVFPPVLGDPPSIAMLSPARLKVDARYQRPIGSAPSQQLIRAMAVGWDWRLCVPLLVSQRPDGLYVIDGQHRREAAILRGDIAYLPCSVSSYADVTEEARLFVAANRKRRSMGRLDDFRAAVAGEEPESVAIDRLVRAAGLRIAQTIVIGPGEVTFVAGMKTALRVRGAEVVGQALQVIGQAFPDTVLNHGGAIFSGLVLELASREEDRASTADLFTALRTRSADAWGDEPPVSLHRGGARRAQVMRSALLAALRAPEAAPSASAQVAVAPEPVPSPAAPAAAPALAAPVRTAAPVGPAPAPRARQDAPLSFEEQLRRVRDGAPISRKVELPSGSPDRTLGGVSGEII